jgi:hypothetical protein
VIVIAALCWCSNQLFGVVCRLPRIGGFESEYAAAHKILSEGTTTDLANCEIYITRQGEDIYAHSNFRSVDSSATAAKEPRNEFRPQSPFSDLSFSFAQDKRRVHQVYHDQPTKIAEPLTKLRSLAQITANIAVDSEAALRTMAAEIDYAAKWQIKYFLDPLLFAPDGSLRIEVGNSANLFVADPQSPPPKRLYPTRSARGPQWMAEISSSLMMKVQGRFKPEQTMDRLQQSPVVKNHFKLISLLGDLSTEKELEKSSLAVNLVKLGAPTEDAIREVFRKNSRGTVAVLGHVEKDHFILKDTAGQKVILELPIEQLAALANEFKCDVVYLGCSAGRESNSVGAINPFNPIFALRRLAAALNEAHYRAFLEKLSGEELRLVIDDTAFTQAATRSTVTNDAPLEMSFATFESNNNWPQSVDESNTVFVGGFILAHKDSWIVWIIVSLALAALGLVGLMARKKRL